VLLAGAGVAFRQWLGALVMHVPAPEPDRPLAERLEAGAFAAGNRVFMRIFKEESELELWLDADSGFALFQTYPVCRWSGSLGPKLAEGDGQSPEGFYRVTRSALNPNSRFHLSFDLGFPNAFDRGEGRTGSALMVHGGRVSVGCYAMTDAVIEEIYRLVEAAFDMDQSAVEVHVFPFRMSAQNLARHEGSRWLAFWRNLKEGYDAFEASRVPPAVSAGDGRYVVAHGPARPVLMDL
jgi:murein L,D-transpeptidase YafK